MREITAKELVKAFEGQLVNIEAPEHYGISIDMDKATIDYHVDNNELTFTAGNYNHGGISTVSIDVEDSIASIEIDDDEEEPAFTITFAGYMPNIVITRFKTIEELEADRKKRQRKNFEVLK